MLKTIFLCALIVVFAGSLKTEAKQQHTSPWVFTKFELPKKKSPDCPCKDCDCQDCKCSKPAVVYVPLVEKPAAPVTPTVQDCPSGMCGPQPNQGPSISEGHSYEQPRRRGLFGRRWR